MIIRLNKYLAECGIASRRKAEQLITEGRVVVNKNVIYELGTKINTETDVIFIDGQKLAIKRKTYFLLNKPKGVITSTKDEKNRVTVVDLIKTNYSIFPVGRLDYNTTGLLILTNDGELSNYLTHPSNKIEREYEVFLNEPLTKEDREKLTSGIILDRKKSKFEKISFPKKNNYKLMRVVTVEGRNHFVKRMFSSLQYRVEELSRIRFGNLKIGNLKKGESRLLSEKELEILKNSNN